MAVRLPLQTVGNFTDTDTGTASVKGGVAHQFNIPQDTDNIVVKFTASVVGASASTVLQTSDDGGTTWYDVARTSIVSNGVPQWLSAPIISPGVSTGVIQSASVVNAAIGTAAASTLGGQQVSGLPILGPTNRVFTIYTGNITASSVVTVVKVNSQSATA
jgi:hypothetical protein